MEKRCKILDTGRKDANIQIGKRLREARLNMNLEKSEIADVLGVTVEHYRKLEAGITGISVDGIDKAQLQRLRKNMVVKTVILNRLCSILDCKIEDIMEFVPDEDIK